jgi:N-acetylglucosamine kinase-like BadF-type ATPase
MILIADSGSTKTVWTILYNGHVFSELYTSGINPYYQSEADIINDLNLNLVPKIDVTKIREIYFYGAGCNFPKKKLIVQKALDYIFHSPKIEINNDLLGASRALFQDKAGIACILGTGSNSCFYNGKEIEQNVSPLGFILGDEGSGAVLGKMLVADVLKNRLSEDLRDKFLSQFGVSTADILDNVYKQAFPNRYLARFASFLSENIQDKSIYIMVYKSFEDFFVRNVMQYDYKHCEVNFVGSIAFYFKTVLLDVATDLQINVQKIEQSPMAGLLNYHVKE